MRTRKKLDVVKANCFGNSFVVVDEREDNRVAEEEYQAFAQVATDTNFGIGADNLLVLQRNTPEVLRRIQARHAYWEELPALECDYIFRMFEPDGVEGLCCGNGLMSIAHYLRTEYAVHNATIATEIPLHTPNLMNIGCDADAGKAWVNLGRPRRVPQDILGRDLADDFTGHIRRVGDIEIQFRDSDLKPYTGAKKLVLNGYLIFTGEPHLVLFPSEGGISVPELTDSIFAESDTYRGAGPIFRQRIRFGSWLVDRIGHSINVNYRHLFPIGININFVSVAPGGTFIEYRCFERGINRETLACGTGAMAAAYVTQQLHGLTGDTLRVLPHRCRWYEGEAEIDVRTAGGDWYLRGIPNIALRGVCDVDSTVADESVHACYAEAAL